MIKKIIDIYKNNKSFIKKTPLLYNKRLSEKYNCQIYLKREDLQITRSFKIRGAYNKLRTLSLEERKQGVCCSSAGNFAQGVAISSAELGIKSDIFVPLNTPKQKIENIRKFSDSNSILHIRGENFDECLNISQKFTYFTLGSYQQ